jgi:hypothetical protein
MIKGNCPIKWKHIQQIWEFESKECRIHVTRLRKEHIFLNPKSVITTKLATQVFNMKNLQFLKDINQYYQGVLEDSGFVESL